MDFLSLKTPIGDMLACADDSALLSLDFCDDDRYQATDNHILKTLAIELSEYFDGNRKEFTIPLKPLGTPFQLRVWETLRQIPYGKTVSYAVEADMLAHPKAVRAVANANGKNPISIIIPCHRVITSGGSIGGYAGGVWRKEFLLKLEETSD
jgi:methylated-DNA-[protein]-cysteine S-methyltransferase